MSPDPSSDAIIDDDDEDVQHESSNTVSVDDDAFPYRQLGVLALCRLAEPIAFISITAYSFVMVQKIKGEENASFYSGLLVSAFALAEACTVMFWGYLSDIYGRKPIILIALAGTALSSLLFGFATNYWVALLARVVGGMLNGNVAVMQTMVAEMVKKPEHEPKAYAVQPFMWSLGSIVGSAVGGFAAEPARWYPKIFSPHGLFAKFPYLLPNLIAVGVIVIAMIQAIFLLEETNPRVKKSPPKQEITSRTGRPEIVSERTPLRHEIRHSQDLGPFGRERRYSAASFMTSSVPMPLDPSFDLRRGSIGTLNSSIMSRKISVVTSERRLRFAPESEPEHESEGSSSDTKPVKAFTRDVNLWIASLVIFSYQQMAFCAVLPIYLLDQPRQPRGLLDLIGGLGLTLPEEGTYLAVNSVIAIAIQGLVFAPVVARIGVWRAVIIFTSFIPVVQILMPLVTVLNNPGVGIYILLTLSNLATIITYPSTLILLKNATPSTTVLGKVNGLAMSACSGARTFAPPVVGLVYSLAGSAAAWWSCAIVALMGAFLFIIIPRPDSGNQAILRKASVAADDERWEEVSP